MAKKIGVVTVTFNSGTVIDDFMKSMLSQTYEDFILYIIDNASTDDTLSRIQRYDDSRINIIPNSENIGVAAGNNQGIKASLNEKCEYVLLINNDTEFEDGLIITLVDGVKKFDCDMVVPKMLYHDPKKLIWFAGGHFRKWRAYAVKHEGDGEYDSGDDNIARKIEYAPTCCMLLKKEMFTTVGLMDEKYFVYYDDTDFCLRALKAKKVMFYLPYAYLTHKVSSLTGGLSNFTTRYCTRNKVYFIRKHMNGLLVLFWLLIYQLLFCVRLISRKDNISIFLLKQKSFFAGLNL